MHIDKLNKRKQSGKAGRKEMGGGGQRLKDSFYKYFGLALVDGDVWALMKLSGHVKAWWGSPNATLTVAPLSHLFTPNIITASLPAPSRSLPDTLPTPSPPIQPLPSQLLVPLPEEPPHCNCPPPHNHTISLQCGRKKKEKTAIDSLISFPMSFL